MRMMRQGDVLIEKCAVPEGAAPVKAKCGRHVLADGEVTGHAHAVSAKAAQMYEREGVLYLRVQHETEVVHEEHAPIPLFPGEYKVTRQREYTPEAIRNVAD